MKFEEYCLVPIAAVRVICECCTGLVWSWYQWSGDEWKFGSNCCKW